MLVDFGCVSAGSSRYSLSAAPLEYMCGNEREEKMLDKKNRKVAGLAPFCRSLGGLWAVLA